VPGGFILTTQTPFLTPVQDIAINLVFAVMEESRCNRSVHEYLSLAERLPPLKVLLHRINEELDRLHQQAAHRGVPLPQICRFQAGDERWEYEEYPQKISRETLRKALDISCLRPSRARK
jgi:hypothetical protein